MTGPSDPQPVHRRRAFTFASEPGARFECSLDGEPFEECESPEEYEVEPGEHAFEVRATDLALNVDGTPARLEWTVLAAPETTLVDSPADPSASTSATFEFASDRPGVEFFCEIDGLGPTLCTSPMTYNGLVDGEHEFTVTAKDATYGLADETPVEYAWTVAVAPDTSILTSPAASTTETSASFTFNANEIDSSFECALDGAAFADCESPVVYTGLAAGSHTFQVRATDGAGNVDATPASHSWTIGDGTPPETTITGKPTDPSTLSSASLVFGGTDNLTVLADLRYECRFDGDTAFTACISPQSYSGLAPGSPYTFDVRAVDAAGNVDPTPATWTWRVTAPDCTSVQTIGANADSWIDQKNGGSNYGGDSVLKLMSKSGENTRALVRFPAPAAPPGCALLSATLRLYAGGYKTGRTLQALALAATWTEGGVNWGNQPATTGSAATTGSGQGYRSWDVTAQVNAMGGNNHGFLIRDAVDNNGGSEQQFHSKEKSDNQPQIVYRYAPGAGSAVSCGTQQTVGASGDAWIDQGAPGANKGEDAILKVVSKGPAHNTRGLVSFGLPALPPGCAVESATLRLHLNALATDRVLEAWRVAGGWSEGGVTWDNQPPTTGEPVTTMSGLGAGATAGWREWNVSAQVVAMYATANQGFLIKDAGDNNGGLEQQFASSESSLNRPELVIRFAAPDTRAPGDDDRQRAVRHRPEHLRDVRVLLQRGGRDFRVRTRRRCVRYLRHAEGILEPRRRRAHAEGAGEGRRRERGRVAGNPDVDGRASPRPRAAGHRHPHAADEPEPDALAELHVHRLRRLHAGVAAQVRVQARRGCVRAVHEPEGLHEPPARVAHVPGAGDRSRRQDRPEPGDLRLDARPVPARDDDRVRAFGDDDELDRDDHVLGRRHGRDVPVLTRQRPVCGVHVPAEPDGPHGGRTHVPRARG